MAKDKKALSFLERLTGAIRVSSNDAELDVELNDEDSTETNDKNWLEESQQDGELAVDMYQTTGDIIIKTMVAGVKPEDLDLTITRDMVTIKGKRESERAVKEGDYFHRELYWGSFSRSVVLPQEVDPAEAEATEKHGLLILRIPKAIKDKQTKIKIKTN